MFRFRIIGAVTLGLTAMLGLSAAFVCKDGKDSTDGTAERWELVMLLHVPRVYNNTESLGYREMQGQRLHGYFDVVYGSGLEPEVRFVSLDNRTHRINRAPITYSIDVGSVKWHAIGNNRTGVFAKRSVVLSFLAKPSYAIRPPDEDNSLLLTLAGFSTKKRPDYLHGLVAGQIGCGCLDHGHVSPTRVWATDQVVDTAAVFGTWYATRVW